MTYREIGEQAGLTGDCLDLYCDYMRARWAEEEVNLCEDGYAFGWAMRFLKGQEWEYSDGEGREILNRLRTSPR